MALDHRTAGVPRPERVVVTEGTSPISRPTNPSNIAWVPTTWATRSRTVHSGHDGVVMLHWSGFTASTCPRRRRTVGGSGQRLGHGASSVGILGRDRRTALTFPTRESAVSSPPVAPGQPRVGHRDPDDVVPAERRAVAGRDAVHHQAIPHGRRRRPGPSSRRCPAPPGRGRRTGRPARTAAWRPRPTTPSGRWSRAGRGSDSVASALTDHSGCSRRSASAVRSSGAIT